MLNIFRDGNDVSDSERVELATGLITLVCLVLLSLGITRQVVVNYDRYCFYHQIRHAFPIGLLLSIIIFLTTLSSCHDSACLPSSAIIRLDGRGWLNNECRGKSL